MVDENIPWTSALPALSGTAPGGTVTWGIVGVYDGEDFTIDPATGVVSMIARDYEDPQDADRATTPTR